MNIKEVADQIEKKAGVDVLSLPVGRRFMTRAPDGQMVMIKAGEAWPIGKPDGSIVVSLFQGEDEVRVYTLAAEASAGQEPPPPTRYTISKHIPAVFAEVMAIETFINEIANEWVVVDEGVSSAERERAAVVAFLRDSTLSYGPPKGWADRIEAGEHVEVDDDEDDEPKAVVPSVSPSAAS